jgi:hypothetical protein
MTQTIVQRNLAPQRITAEYGTVQTHSLHEAAHMVSQLTERLKGRVSAVLLIIDGQLQRETPTGISQCIHGQ